MNKILKYLVLSTVSLLFFSSFHSYQKSAANPDFLSQKETWSDSVLQSLTIKERIGQLFMVAAYSNKSQALQI